MHLNMGFEKLLGMTGFVLSMLFLLAIIVG
jgi:hypothetical protein